MRHSLRVAYVTGYRPPVHPALIVDALLGYSLVGAPRPRLAALIRWAGTSGIPVLSLDVPSGVDATTGETPGEYLPANRTLTLALPKTGLRPDHSGEVILADLGVPGEVFRRVSIPYRSPFGARFSVSLRMVTESTAGDDTGRS